MVRPTLIALLHLILAAACPAQNLLLLSLDGFRWDYLDRPAAAWLAEFGKQGVRAEALIPCFPSKTYPSHYTIATGLHPEHHGVVSNEIHDPEDGHVFSPKDQTAVEESRWWGGEPLWVTATKQGKVTGVSFWPGSEAAIQGVHPRYWKRYDHHRPFSQQIDEILGWLDAKGADRPSVIMSYFREPDSAGHVHGPDSREVDSAIAEVVGALKTLEKGLAARGLLESTDIVILSDHGMTTTTPEKVIYLDDFVKTDELTIAKLDPVSLLWPKAGSAGEIAAKLEKAHPHLTVYRKEAIPDELHFRDHRLVSPLVAVADLGWSIRLRADEGLVSAMLFPRGAHGYSNQEKDMWGIFLARGPSFQKGLTPPAFPNVHVYALMCRLAGLTPAKNDGDPAVTASFLASPAPGK